VDRATTPSIGIAGLGIPSPLRRPATEAPRPAAQEAVSLATRHDAARATALAALVERALASVDTSALADGAPPDDALSARIERALADATPAVQASGLSADQLVAEARREIVELGPLGPLL